MVGSGLGGEGNRENEVKVRKNVRKMTVVLTGTRGVSVLLLAVKTKEEILKY